MSKRTDQQEPTPVHKLGYSSVTPCGFDSQNPGPVKRFLGSTRWGDVTCLKCIEQGEKRYDGPQSTWPEWEKEDA